MDLVLIDGGKIYLEKDLPFKVTVFCKVSDEWNSEVNQCYRSNAKVRAAFTFEFNDLKIYASLHTLHFGIDYD